MIQQQQFLLLKKIITMHNESSRWLVAPPQRKLKVPYLKSRPIKALQGNQIEFEVFIDSSTKISIVSNIQDSFEMSQKSQLYQDMCEMNVLNQPEVLRNIVERYSKDQIFTYIGPTLIVVNPYRIIEKLFNEKVLMQMRQKILCCDMKQLSPHVFMIAGKAYNSMLGDEHKQAIIISGQSGAGKTESTKYCMQMLTSLSHKEKHAIEKKILACNPLLQAFGNSKTVRNDNSSRFGKYVQIFFGLDNTIKGANINSYLLQKSRVTSISSGQRTFHAFYALTASGKFSIEEAEQYTYLKQSNCYTAAYIKDSKYFDQIGLAMNELDFAKEEQQKIWRLLKVILNLGNLEFDDKKHQNNQSNPCEIIKKDSLEQISKILGISTKHLQKVLLFQKKVILKEVNLKPYNQQSCMSNTNTLSKAIYNSIFEFILFKIQIQLKPPQHHTQQYKSINLLDIFGFQNFKENSFEQLCINFTNQKLLKQYNKYIFENQMEILKQDGLSRQVQSIKAPTNDAIIHLLSGNLQKKLSLFSIVNDNTSNVQFKDEDIMGGFRRDFSSTNIIKFDKIQKGSFTIYHSQCSVTYNVNGFKFKNQDKVNSEIEQIYTKLFHNQNKNQVGKTLLHKFEKEIDDLMTELGSATNHFIRCIKPNQIKKQRFMQENYVLTQVRYLGVFETIQIRQKTFPARKLYEEFVNIFQPVFASRATISKDPKIMTKNIFKEMKAGQKQYLIGNKRVYMSKDLDEKLSLQLYLFFKIKNQKAAVIQKSFRKYIFRKVVLAKLKILVKRKFIWKRFGQREKIKILQDARQKMLTFDLKRKKQIQEIQKKQAEEIAKKKGKELPLLTAKVQKVQKEKIQEVQQKPKNIVSVNKENESLKEILNNKSQVNNESLDETIIIDSHEGPYQRTIEEQKQIQKQGGFNESFIEGPSVVYQSSNPNTLFQKTLIIKQFQGKNNNFFKLQKILAQQYKLEVSGNQEEFFSPVSEDCSFKIQEAPGDLLNKVVCFDADEFFNKVLRKRTSFLGMKKEFTDILVYKPKQLNKTLTLIPSSDQDKSLKLFKLILRIGQEPKLDNVFKLIQSMINLCQSTSNQLKNEVFLQLIKQSNTTNQLTAIRIYQCLAVFLHIYTPDSDFMLAAMFIFFTRLGEEKHQEKQEEYLRYLFKKMIRKIQNPHMIGYMPIKYQIMALMCKRQISIPIYLPIGNSILIRVQSYHTFADIKEKIVTEFGININRFKPQFFKFFEIVNFQNEELQESPINQNQIVWDVMTYWELAKQKYKEANTNPPAFFLMLKIVYVFELHEDDTEGVEICFAQCYFDYFIGRIRLDFEKMAALAACVKKIKLSDRPQNQFLGSYPIWMAKKFSKQKLSDAMIENASHFAKENLAIIDMKYRFIEICDLCPISMSMAIPTEQPQKLYFKPKKLYIVDKGEVVNEISMRSIIKWAIDKEKFAFDVKKGSNHVILTEYAQVCSLYLNDLPKILKENS